MSQQKLYQTAFHFYSSAWRE